MKESNTSGVFFLLFVFMLSWGTGAVASEEDAQPGTQWRSPDEDILQVLHAPRLPRVWTAPGGDYLLLADPVEYPSLEKIASTMHKLAGIRVDPELNYYHGRSGYTSPRILKIESGEVVPLDLPEGAEVFSVDFTADGSGFALSAGQSDHVGLWIGSPQGDLFEIEGLALNYLLADAVEWLPDQERLLVVAVPDRGPVPSPPAIPAGPEIAHGEGASARSTYEARDLLQTAYDDSLFDYYCSSKLVVVEPESGHRKVIGERAHYCGADFSPDGRYILVQRLVEPWSHEVAWWRFARETEVWDADGDPVAEVASLPLSDEVPIHGVPTGPRWISWRATAPHELYMVEALDGGDPMAEADYRDRLLRLEEPFTEEPEEVIRTRHRIQTWLINWAEQGGTLMLGEYERMRRWYYVWLLDVDEGTAQLWYERDSGDRYGNPGYPVTRRLPNGQWVMRQQGEGIYFSGSGSTEEGDRPFLDLKSMATGETTRLFRCHPDRYEYFVDFAGNGDSFLIRSESPVDVPNYHLATLGAEVEAEEGEAERELSLEPVTGFQDPTPQLRDITSEIVTYEREDGVPLSFHLYLPPDYQEGTRLPTVVSAYPLEYSSAATAGQVSGSTRRFMRMYGPSSLYFLLRGYAVLSRTAMPMIGDPETTYDTFVPQLVADAEAAVEKAVEMGVADPERIGVIGHSHGGLMVANLLAHTDIFTAGIARSGSYNKTNQPFGFQAERRSLFQARDVYIQVSPTFFADQVDEPILLIHGGDDSNPGTRTYQSEIFYEAVRGSGGTVRLVLLPHEDHGYRARESVEHVLWEQLRWFDMYLKGE